MYNTSKIARQFLVEVIALNYTTFWCFAFNLKTMIDRDKTASKIRRLLLCIRDVYPLLC